MRKCSLFVAVVAVVLAVGLTAAYASHQTSREIEVKLMKVGEKGKTLKNNGKEHSFTLKDLSDGKTEYWIKKDKKAYLVQMVRDDIVTLAGGETITVLVLPAMEVDTSDDSDAIAGPRGDDEPARGRSDVEHHDGAEGKADRTASVDA